jgi:hypothetical protein
VSGLMAAAAERQGSANVDERDLKKDMRPDWVVRSVPAGMVASRKERRTWKVYVEGSWDVVGGMSWTVAAR